MSLNRNDQITRCLPLVRGDHGQWRGPPIGVNPGRARIHARRSCGYQEPSKVPPDVSLCGCIEARRMEETHGRVGRRERCHFVHIRRPDTVKLL